MRPHLLLKALGKVLLVFAAMVLALLLGVFGWLRWHGLPEQWKAPLLLQLEARGLYVSFDQLTLDWSGGVRAKNFILYKGPQREESWTRVDAARIGFAWLSWWRGQPLVHSVSVNNAVLELPWPEGSTLSFRKVNAYFELDRHAIRVRRAQARFENCQLSVQGTLRLNGWQPRVSTGTPEEAQARREKLQKSIMTAVEELRALRMSRPIQVRLLFEATTHDPLLGQASLFVDSRRLDWRGRRLLDELSLQAAAHEGQMQVRSLRVKMGRGELNAEGSYDLLEKNAQLQWQSTIHPVHLAPWLPGAAERTLTQLHFDPAQPPLMSGSFKMLWGDPGQPPSWNVQADVNWKNFMLGGQRFARLEVPVAFNGRQLLVSDLHLEHASGQLHLDAYWQQDDGLWRARLNSSLDPTIFKGVISPGVDRFLASCQFRKKGPSVRVEAQIPGGDFKKLSARGHAAVGACSYKGIALDSGAADLEFDQGKLTLRNFSVQRSEGEVSGELIYDFPGKRVQLENLRSTVNVQEVAPALGAKFTEYVRPYHFDVPPSLTVRGQVDLDEDTPDSVTDLNIDIDAKTRPATLTWRLLGIPWRIGSVKGKLTVVGRKLTVSAPACEFLGGSLATTVEVALVRAARYQVQLHGQNLDFHDFMRTAFHNDQSRGDLNVDAELSGTLDDMKSLNGEGRAVITEGYITSIPIFGGLSKFVSAVIPDFGFAKADKASTDFKIAGGIIEAPNLEISSAAFALIGHGRYDFIEDDLDMNIRLNARGLPGLLFYSVSKLFEYQGRGSIREPHWEPKNF